MSNQDYIFGLAAFDINGNEFNSIDGIHISWFLGADKEIAKFQVFEMGEGDFATNP